MIKALKKHFTFRKGFIIGVIALVISNLLFITMYYRLYLNERINKNYIEVTEKLNKELDNIEINIKETNEDNKYLDDYVNKENISITIRDENDNHLATYEPNKKRKSKKNNVSVSRIMKYEEHYYLVTISQKQDLLNVKTAVTFLICELIIVVILTLMGIIGANSKLLGPISHLSQDLNHYKLGILPKKRKIHSGVDIIQNDFVDLVEKLEDEKEKQNNIIASISHDIKTPLTSILGYSELLLNNEISNDTRKKYTNKIHTKSLEMKEIVEEFDDYLSCNIKDESKAETISILSLVEYLNSYYKEDLKEKNIEFKVKTNCPTLLIKVDLAKLKRVFSNTITNSIRHLNKTKKIININIFIQKNDKIKFEIADNGTGCKENLEKVFEPLYTTDKSRKISGLGLSICKEIILSHGGTIKAENNKLGGFSIIFTIDSYKEK